jgi:hypothetical protein
MRGFVRIWRGRLSPAVDNQLDQRGEDLIKQRLLMDSLVRFDCCRPELTTLSHIATIWLTPGAIRSQTKTKKAFEQGSNAREDHLKVTALRRGTASPPPLLPEESHLYQ